MDELEDGPIAPLPPSQSRPIDQKMILMIAGGVLLLALVVTVAYLVVRLMPNGNTVATAPPPAPNAPVNVPLPAFPELPAAPVASEPIRPTLPAKPVYVRRPRYVDLAPAPPVLDDKAFVLTEQAIDASLKRGIEYILAQYDGSQLKAEVRATDLQDGLHALAALSLVYASKTLEDQRLSLQSRFMRGVLDHLKTLPMENNLSNYTRSLRLSALSLAGRPQDRPTMTADLQWLIQSNSKGGFAYGRPAQTTPPPVISPDGSNSQYGVLGVWAAADAGLNVSPAFWNDVRTYWLGIQREDGGWSYRGKDGSSSASMTAAGVTCLALTAQQHSIQPGANQPPVNPNAALQRGTDWLGKGEAFAGVMRDEFPGYTVYGIERAGLASGYRFMGNKDWFLTLAPLVIQRQQKDGTWPGNVPLIETTFFTLFLSRGSYPILMTKLEFDGAWNTRPTDLAALTRYAGPNLERNFNWQIVPITQPWQNWTGSPVVYMASDAAPSIDAAGLDQIKGFVEHGNLLFSHADKGSEAFNAWVEATAAKLFPDYPMRDVPEDHPIYSVAAIIKKKQPLRMVSNGSRVLWLHSPTDVSDKWQKRFERSDPDGFGLGVNVSVYATGLAPFRSRLQSVVEKGPLLPDAASFPIVRIKHSANWNAEPAAWSNFGRWLGEQASIGTYTVDAEPDKLEPFEYPVAHLTGTTTYLPSKADVTALTKYVNDGGILLVDATGGSKDFADSAKLLVNDLIAGGAGLESLTPTHPLLAIDAKWPILPRIETRVAVGRGEDDETLIPKVYRLGKGSIVLFDRDLTTGLLGANVWNLHGYTPAWSRAMVRNLIVATIDRAKKTYPATAPTAAAPVLQ